MTDEKERRESSTEIAVSLHRGMVHVSRQPGKGEKRGG